MRTDHIFKVVKFALTVALVPTCATAQAQTWQSDWELDQQMAVLEGPVWRPIIIPYGDGLRRGAPQWTYYRQQPPGVQGDFRQLPPSGGGVPIGGATPGLPGGESSSSGGNAGGTVADGGSAVDGSGAGGGGGGNIGQGPQLPPPDIGGPEIPMDPLPLPPPITPPF